MNKYCLIVDDYCFRCSQLLKHTSLFTLEDKIDRGTFFYSKYVPRVKIIDHMAQLLLVLQDICGQSWPQLDVPPLSCAFHNSKGHASMLFCVSDLYRSRALASDL